MRDINELINIIKRINFDNNNREVLYLQSWVNRNRNLAYDSEQMKLIKLVDAILEVRKITDDKRIEILECCDNFIKDTSDKISKAYELNNMIESMSCDHILKEEERYHLKEWIKRNSDSTREYKSLKSLYKIINKIWSDGIVTAEEQEQLHWLLVEHINDLQFETKFEYLRKQVKAKKILELI